MQQQTGVLPCTGHRDVYIYIICMVPTSKQGNSSIQQQLAVSFACISQEEVSQPKIKLTFIDQATAVQKGNYTVSAHNCIFTWNERIPYL